MPKCMSIQARREMLASIQTKYQSSDWEVKNQLLNGFIATTGYNRKHAIKLLNEKLKRPPISSKKSNRSIIYDESVV